MLETWTDRGVSPVIAVVLMVAITVVLAATVYVFVSGLGGGSLNAVNATVRGQAFDLDGDGAAEFARLTLVSGGGFPADQVHVGTLDPDTGASYGDVCESADVSEGSCVDPFEGSDRWRTGSALFVPCRGSGSHQVSVTVGDSLVFDNAIRCGEAA